LQVCLKSNKTNEDDLSPKTVPGDDNDKNSLLSGLNIRKKEFSVKEKGGIKTESLEIGNDLDSGRLKNKNLHFDSKDVTKISGFLKGAVS